MNSKRVGSLLFSLDPYRTTRTAVHVLYAEKADSPAHAPAAWLHMQGRAQVDKASPRVPQFTRPAATLARGGCGGRWIHTKRLEYHRHYRL